jgi:hypothetical protein
MCLLRHGRLQLSLSPLHVCPILSSNRYFSSIGLWQWRLLVSLVVLTIVPAAVFVVAEIARKTKPDGSTGDKLRPEIIAEGVILLILIVAWIPVIMM